MNSPASKAREVERFLRGRRGQGVLEFVLMFTVLAITVVFSAFHIFKPSVTKMYADAGTKMNDSGGLIAEDVGQPLNMFDDETGAASGGGFAGNSGGSSGGFSGPGGFGSGSSSGGGTGGGGGGGGAGTGGGIGATGGSGGGSDAGAGGSFPGSGGGAEGVGRSFPQTPLAIGNDSFLSLSWEAATGTPVSYNIYRATAPGGPYEFFVEGWTATWFTDVWTTNGSTYYYRVDAVYDDGAVVSSGVFSGTPSADSVYAVAAAEALTKLDESSNGSALADIIDLYDVKIGFGTGVSDAVGWYSSYFNTIIVDLSQFGLSQGVQTSILAHEGTHAWWTNDTSQGQPERGTNLGDSIDQEYNAFLNGAAVWNEIKDGDTDANQDGWASVVALDEASAKEIIRTAYPDLPEY
ncbi:hypothetical protein BU251_07720 [Candidatus Velamenicoccus archaeovorus]|uniref:Fibronectin type-III domain-containing protein n=1 Tax=Velamenicoccus archaeovorus TaxID=1930593 RepID=A0A410P689_VELA1|nr:hypothetical protein [Candidatus Velamenicoccus archaeovorus]QAT17612.1 hypothetical protein BU251_07720 [Candidatus Velamenicoccus archaeovorus]